jgi:hypothetical protein
MFAAVRRHSLIADLTSGVPAVHAAVPTIEATSAAFGANAHRTLIFDHQPLPPLIRLGFI